MDEAPLKPYPAYKPAGIPWMLQVPEHWEVVRMGALLQERGESNDGQKEQHVLSLLRQRGVIPYDEKGRVGNKKSEDITRYKIVRPNDIVVNSMNVIIGSVGISKYTGCLSPVYYVLKTRSERDSPFYLNYVFQIEQFQKSLIGIGNGILAHRMRIAMEKFKCELFPRPPIAEQHLIVRYLHALDAKVKRYIRSKRSLIARLQEQKQAIIQQAVTRGLDPNVKLKPSGVEWLGEVPEHWEVRRVSSFCRVGNGSTPLRGQTAYWTAQGFPWLNSASVNSPVIKSSTQFVTKRALKECHLPVVQPGSVLVAITGQGKTRGTAALLAIEATINQHLAYLAPKADVCSGLYLREFLAASYSALREISDNSGSTKGALTCAQLKQFKVALPPVDEQRDILRTLEDELRIVNGSLRQVQEEINLMLEYHTRLNADVVTGAVDVRAAAKAMPVEVESAFAEATADEEESLSMAAEGEEGYGEE